MDQSIPLRRVNPCITCSLCEGYLIDATTITECLHTFCKSCIVKYLQQNTDCPECGNNIHQSHPLNYISHDRTMQDIVYKLVPNLLADESERERQFYTARGLPIPSLAEEVDSSAGATENNNNDTADDANEDADRHRSDEQVKICLECGDGKSLKSLKRKFIRCSSQATITHLKKYIALKLYNDTDRYRDFDILCNNEPLGKDHTLKFITVTRWRAKNKEMLSLQYRPKTVP